MSLLHMIDFQSIIERARSDRPSFNSDSSAWLNYMGDLRNTQQRIFRDMAHMNLPGRARAHTNLVAIQGLLKAASYWYAVRIAVERGLLMPAGPPPPELGRPGTEPRGIVAVRRREPGVFVPVKTGLRGRIRERVYHARPGIVIIKEREPV